MLYLVVMILSVVLYLSMVRAIAKTSVHNLTYHLVFLLFFAALVEFALLLEEFMNRLVVVFLKGERLQLCSTQI